MPVPVLSLERGIKMIGVKTNLANVTNVGSIWNIVNKL